ncbi:hypothetical protein BPIT_34700 [Candidatus Brocadia pituitae]|nr:hypothetical protein BPIT_34700 [Candidatus Brocadia pituitae]
MSLSFTYELFCHLNISIVLDQSAVILSRQGARVVHWLRIGDVVAMISFGVMGDRKMAENIVSCVCQMKMVVCE